MFTESLNFRGARNLQPLGPGVASELFPLSTELPCLGHKCFYKQQSGLINFKNASSLVVYFGEGSNKYLMRNFGKLDFTY